MSAAAVEGFREVGIASAAKHFPNHGPATEDTHIGQPHIEQDTRTIMDRDLRPFRSAIEAGAPIVMVGHLVYLDSPTRGPRVSRPRP